MQIRYPEYYKKFRCLAGECPDTCCAGWEIPVDRESEKRYHAVQKENHRFGRKLRKYIKNGQIMSESRVCPFLDGEKLCEIYKEMGPDALCRTCRRHPRHREDYGNLHEILLLLSCPEAARLVLEENSGNFYVRDLPERTGNTDGIDGELLELLLKTREEIWDVGTDRSLSMDRRMALALKCGYRVQRRIGPERADGHRMRQPSAKGDRAAAKPEAGNRFLLMSDFMEALSGLEPVGDLWPKMLEEARTILYHSRDSREQYQARRHRFPAPDSDAERLFGYFIYSFFLTSLFDRDPLTKVKMAVLCTMAVEELDLAAGIQNPEAAAYGPGIEQQIKICHVFARQIENDDENREALERLLKRREFSARRICTALLPED